MSLLYYDRLFSSLRMNRSNDKGKSPHKVAMLLAVIDLVEESILTTNIIKLDENLQKYFTVNFESLAKEGDRNNPHMPFYHLKTSGFWHHKIKPGKSNEYERLAESLSQKSVQESISYSYLDNELFEILCNQYVRRFLRSSLEKNLSPENHIELLKSGNSWDWIECELIVGDYFDMLHK